MSAAVTTTSSSSAPAPAAARCSHRLAPTGQAHPAPRARRLRAAREGELELARRQRRGPATTRRRRGATRTASRSTRTRTTTSAATPSSTARRSFACASDDFGELRHHGGVSPAWPISYDDLEPYYTAGRAPVPRARQARRGPDRAAARARPYRYPAVSHEPRIQQLERRLRALGPASRSTCRSASGSTRRTPHKSPCIRCSTCDGYPVPGERQGRRRRSSASIRRSSIPTSRC